MRAETQQAEAVRERMNRLAERGEAFFFAINYERTEALLYDAQELAEGVDLCFRLGDVSYPDGVEDFDYEIPHIESVDAEGEDAYAGRFARLREALLSGDTFLANLTIRTPIRLSADLKAVYHASQAPYKLHIPKRLVCFSPEAFVRISAEGIISTYPMKGTIDASLPNAEDRLREDYKEGSEHYTIVDLMRNDLSRIAEDVHVQRFKYMDEVRTHKGKLLQMSSEICGQLCKGWQAKLGNILWEMLPAGSISGAPKQRTIEVIREAEGNMPRGFYTGVFGYFDGSQLSSAVMIRFIEEDEGRHFYRSGSGITINSHMQEEYAECLAKIYLPCSQIG